MKKYILILMVGFLMGNNASSENNKHSFIPEQGFVPDENTAIKIAEAVWLPIYGDSIYNKKPFVASLKDGVWVVQGSLSKHLLGGVPVAEISKENGAVLRVSHGK